MRVTVDGKSYDVTVEILAEGEKFSPPVAASTDYHATPVSASQDPKQALAVLSKDGVVSPMSGSIFKVLIKEGDTVKAGQDVLVLEAMKMESPIASPIAGKVTAIKVREGQSVEEGQLLFKVKG